MCFGPRVELQTHNKHKDAIAKCPVLGKTAYRERVRRTLKTLKAQQTAKNIANSLRKSCRMVLKAKGAAVRG